MPISKHKRAQLLALCGQLNEDDNVDPRHFFRKRYRSRNSRAQRLCSQVAETLALVLAGEFPDEILQSLEVFSVQPAPDTRRLLVVVRPAADMLKTTTPNDVVTKLNGVSKILRTEVAAAISRRRMPSLIYEVLWPSDSVSRG